MPGPSSRGPRLLRAAPAAALALVLLSSPPASAGPTERLRDFFAAVNTILADPEIADKPLERIVRMRRLVGEVSDVHEAAAVALDPEWQMRSRAEQDEFVTLFADLLERAYVGRLAGRSRVVDDGVRIAYLGESVAGDEAIVETTLGAREGGEALIEYRMVNRQGRWRIRDVVLEGVSTVENYRAQFRRILREGSYQDLIGLIRAKLDQESLMFARVGGRSASASAPARTEPVQFARFDDGVTDGTPPAVTLRSRQVGWIVDAEAIESVPQAAPLRSRQIGWIVRTATTPAEAPKSGAPAAWYWVQVAAFKTIATAGNLAERLIGGTVVSSSSGRLQLVRVGPFAERVQAVSKLRELQALGYQPFIAEARD